MDIKIVKNMNEKENLYASISESRFALEGLNKTDYVKLLIIAKYYTNSRKLKEFIQPEDILQDAILRTLNGKRRWSKKVTIIKHLAEVMRSISGHEAKKQINQNTIPLSDIEINSISHLSNAEESVLIQDELNSILELFQNDDVSMKIISLKAEGYSASEIRQQLGINSTNYDSVLKRIKRRVTKYTMKGEN